MKFPKKKGTYSKKLLDGLELVLEASIDMSVDDDHVDYDDDDDNDDNDDS